MELTFIILILIIVAVYLSLPTKCDSQDKKKEAFHTYHGYYKQYCPSCGWRSRNTCSKCTNCGYCITASGYGECVPGDNNGPYFRSDCLYWEYGDPYYNYPYSNIYPVTTVNSVYPRYDYQIRKPTRWRSTI